MGRFLLFVDGSVNPGLKIGYGCYLLLPEELIRQLTPAKLKAKQKVKKFDSTSSSRLEIETLLWALKETEKTFDKKNEIVVYTDSQNIMELKNRRERLERENFQAKKKQTDLKNTDLYKKFYQFMDQLNFKVVKITGHSKSKEKDEIDRIFLQVDRTSRKALREYIAGRQSI
jgi:ribonuclease HI